MGEPEPMSLKPPCPLDFESWLLNRLKELQTDEAVFGPYIQSILDGDEDEDEKLGALDELLVDLLNGANIDQFRDEILTNWKSYREPPVGSQFKDGTGSQILNGKNGAEGGEEEEDQFSQLLRAAAENAELASQKSKNSCSQADPKLRAAILSSTMNQSSDSEEEAEGLGQGPSASGGTKKKKNTESSLAEQFGRNVNLEKVANEQKEMRDKNKAEHALKKERDKEDRAKQKAAAQDRKDKAKKKATKVERKR